MERVLGIGGLFFRARDPQALDPQALDPQPYPNGRFALHDPEGNPIELWEPNGRDAPATA